MAWIDARGIVVIIFLARNPVVSALWKRNQLRSYRTGAAVVRAKRTVHRRQYSVASQSDGYLLIRCESQRCTGIGHTADYESAVVAPSPGNPFGIPRPLIARIES